MDAVVGKVERDELCERCQNLLNEISGNISLCVGCAQQHDADMAVAVNSSQANLLVDGEIHDGPQTT